MYRVKSRVLTLVIWFQRPKAINGEGKNGEQTVMVVTRLNSTGSRCRVIRSAPIINKATETSRCVNSSCRAAPCRLHNLSCLGSVHGSSCTLLHF